MDVWNKDLFYKRQFWNHECRFPEWWREKPEKEGAEDGTYLNHSLYNGSMH